MLLNDCLILANFSLVLLIKVLLIKVLLIKVLFIKVLFIKVLVIKVLVIKVLFIKVLLIKKACNYKTTGVTIKQQEWLQMNTHKRLIQISLNCAITNENFPPTHHRVHCPLFSFIHLFF